MFRDQTSQISFAFNVTVNGESLELRDTFMCLLLFVSLVLLGRLLFCVIKVTPQALPCVIEKVVEDSTAFFFPKLAPSNGQYGHALSSAWLCFLVRAVA